MSNNRQCQMLANRFKKFIKGEPKKSSYEIVLKGNKSSVGERNTSISEVSLKLNDFDESSSVPRQSLRKSKSVNDKLTVGKSKLLKSDSEGNDNKSLETNPMNRRCLQRKSKSLKPASQLNGLVHNKLTVPFKQSKALYSPSKPTSSCLCIEDENEVQSIRGVFPQTGVYHLTAKSKGQYSRRNSCRKRAFFHNFRRTSVRYSSRRKKRKLKGCKSATYNSTRVLTPLIRSFSDNDVIDGFSPAGMNGKLFGRLLEDICDENELPPKSIFILLDDLSRRGPSEVGIFRKSGNARVVREFKASLDKEEEIVLNSSTPVSIVASLFKDFLRSLPNCLFCSELYEQWLELSFHSTKDEKVQAAQHLCSCIPGSHRILVKLLLYVLNLIAAKSDLNMMTPANLGICLGPSILNSGKRDFNYNPKVSEVLSFMITNFDEVFGENDRKSLENLLRQSFNKSEENEASEYSEQFLSQTTKHSGVSSSIDSGICSGFEDNNFSDFATPVSSTPVSSLTLTSKVSVDEVDTPLRNTSFQRNNWMRKGVIKKRSSSKDIRITVGLVSVL